MEAGKESNNDEINLIDYIKVISRHRKMIIYIVAVVVVLTAIWSMVITPTYAAKTVLMPTIKPKEIGGGAEQVAMQLGLSVPTSPGTSEIVNILNSNALKEKVIRHYNLLPVFFKGDSLKETENQKIWRGIRYLERRMKVTNKQKEGIVELTFEFNDPNETALITQDIIDELNEYMSSEAKRVAETNKKYLESDVNTVSDPFIKDKIFNLIAQQAEMAVMAEAKENFAFKVLDPPMVPDRRIRPKRGQMVMISFVTSLFAGIFAAFLKEYIQKQKVDKI